MQITNNKKHPSLSIYNNMYVMIYGKIINIVIYRRGRPYSYITKFQILEEQVDERKIKGSVLWL